MPGVDPAEAVRVVAGETDFAFVPELPGRGVGADPIGRTASILIDLPVEMMHATYRCSYRPGAVARAARDYLARDLDALEEHWDREGLIGSGRLLKVQACGPFTYAARVELRSGHKMVRDAGAVRDVVASLADGLVDHVADLERRLGAQIVVQLDEPDLQTVIDGRVPPLTRLDVIPPIPVPDVAQHLEEVAATVRRPMILHAGPRPNPAVRALIPSYAPTADLTKPLTDADKDDIGQFLDGGGVLVAGAVPAKRPAVVPDAEEIARRLAAVVDEIGLDRSVLRDGVVVTPTSGLAAASPAWAVTALELAARTAQILTEDPEAL